MTNIESGLPFNDFRSLLDQLPPEDVDAKAHTKNQVIDQMGPDGGLFGEVCVWYSAWSGRSPAVSRPLLTLFAGTHSADKSGDVELLDEIVEISGGTSPVNRICDQHNLGLKVLDLALQIPVADITKQAALDEKECAGTMAFGMESIAGGNDLFCAAAIEMEPNVSVLAILSAMWGADPAKIVGKGKSDVLSNVQLSLENTEGRVSDGLEALRQLGGRETAAMCGAILSARMEHVPVLLAGPSAIACVAVLETLKPGATSHCMMAQKSGIAEMDRLADEMNLQFLHNDFLTSRPAIQLALAAGMVKSACLEFSASP
ncbi:MAG: nicotinate-nucleotide--dimethylbenzimidazole phosphoribosyltransferase [Pseudomonadota bacterium]